MIELEVGGFYKVTGYEMSALDGYIHVLDISDGFVTIESYEPSLGSIISENLMKSCLFLSQNFFKYERIHIDEMQFRLMSL